ncbi:hypothetical protein Pcinc_032497 [Petrolisthes cinctipes]|uniref:Uncharacterized protein n=1 Tax=Petrolisthes cinctipes TaxID=88211 RepID=A0AAE1EU18_PETCI|nr:hypothetical protein Pcinc_032497 [Petrolisthes cinctipes]
MSYNLDFTDEEFSNIVLKNENNEVHVRTNAFDDNEAWRWKEVFTKKNNISFNVQKLSKSVSSTFHEKFICIFGDKHHKGVRQIYTGCGVKMDIKIKLITKATCNKDKDVRAHPCTVIIEGVHNHHTESASALHQLPETRDALFQNFDLGCW